MFLMSAGFLLFCQHGRLKSFVYLLEIVWVCKEKTQLEYYCPTIYDSLTCVHASSIVLLINSLVVSCTKYWGGNITVNAYSKVFLCCKFFIRLSFNFRDKKSFSLSNHALRKTLQRDIHTQKYTDDISQIIVKHWWTLVLRWLTGM